MSIHPSSVISPEAEIDKDVEIGPFCYIRGKTRIGAGTRVESHVSLGSDSGILEIGRNNRIRAGAVVGGPPQDLKYKGEATQLIIGDNNDIRELATINLGTPTGGGLTKIGNHCLLMAYVHIAHDCLIGDHVVIANTCQFGGHVVVEDHAKIGGVCAFNQFTRIGRYAFVAGDSAVNKDILPYTIAQGKYAVMRATNKIGLERAGFTKDEIENINRAVRIITKGTDTMEAALDRIKAECTMSPHLEHFISFMKSTQQGLAK